MVLLSGENRGGHGFTGQVQAGASAEASKAGYPWTTVFRRGGSAPESSLRHCMGILAAVYGPVESFLANSAPTINCGNSRGRMEGIGNILSDDVATGRMAARYLRQRGHREFLAMNLPGRVFSRERLEGFAREIKAGGGHLKTIDFPVLKSKPSRPDWSPYEELSAQALQLLPYLQELPPDAALFGVNDDAARLLLHALIHFLPERAHTTAVLGVDDDPGSVLFGGEMSDLSSVRPGFHRVGVEGMKWFAEHPGDKEAVRELHLRIPPEGVVERMSTAGPACQHAPTARAIRAAWARVQAGNPPSVEELATSQRVSTRTLNRFFKSVLGQSAKSYLLQLRLEHGKALLREHPQMLIEEVAHRCGFGKQSLFAAHFRERFGRAPREWRKQPPVEETVAPSAWPDSPPVHARTG